MDNFTKIIEDLKANSIALNKAANLEYQKAVTKLKEEGTEEEIKKFESIEEKLNKAKESLNSKDALNVISQLKNMINGN